jgi:hypothetical protein
VSRRVDGGYVYLRPRTNNNQYRTANPHRQPALTAGAPSPPWLDLTGGRLTGQLSSPQA